MEGVGYQAKGVEFSVQSLWYFLQRWLQEST